MILSDEEMKLFNILKSGETVPLDDIQGCMANGFSDPDAKVRNRKALIVRLKYLSAKVAQGGWIITSESKRGRGAKACYKMIRKF